MVFSLPAPYDDAVTTVAKLQELHREMSHYVLYGNMITAIRPHRPEIEVAALREVLDGVDRLIINKPKDTEDGS